MFTVDSCKFHGRNLARENQSWMDVGIFSESIAPKFFKNFPKFTGSLAFLISSCLIHLKSIVLIDRSIKAIAARFINDVVLRGSAQFHSGLQGLMGY
jgi:hypothetical protein